MTVASRQCMQARHLFALFFLDALICGVDPLVTMCALIEDDMINREVHPSRLLDPFFELVFGYLPTPTLLPRLFPSLVEVIGVFSALITASYSDVVGRRPLLQASAIIQGIPYFVLFAGLFIHGQWIYWVLCLAITISKSFDITGVYLAMVSDVVQPLERAQAYDFFVSGSAGLLATFAAIGYTDVYTGTAVFLPRGAQIMLASIAVIIRQLYLVFDFPESAPALVGEEAKPQRGIFDAPRHACGLIHKHRFNLRLSGVLLLWGLGSAGCSRPPIANTVEEALIVIWHDWTDGYHSFYVVMYLLVGQGFFIFAAFLGLAVQAFGEVRVLHLSLLASMLLPLFLWAAVGPYSEASKGAVIATLILAGPISWVFPDIVAIASNLVRQSDHGLMLGTLAAIRSSSDMLGKLFVLLWKVQIGQSDFRYSHGLQKSDVTLAIMALARGLALLSAYSLPLEVPGLQARFQELRAMDSAHDEEERPDAESMVE